MRLTDTRAALAEVEYPATTEELCAACGDHELDLGEETERLADVLGRVEATYDDAEDAELAVYSALSGEAVGRKGYSDRDPTVPGSPLGPDDVSF
jgi:hypothetical protein